MYARILHCFSLILLLGTWTIASAQTADHPKKERREKKTEQEMGDTVKHKKFHIGDYIKIGGLVNAQYGYTYQQDNDSEVEQTSVFQVRRARLDVRGEIHPKFEYRIQAELANSPKLLDAYVKLKFCKYANLQVGQFKIPFTLENPYSPTDLEFIDNAQIVNRLSGYSDVSGVTNFANGREIGLMLYGTLAQFERDGEKYPILSYSVGVFGGNGINVKKDNMAKDIAGRLEFRPWLKHFTLSGSAYWGRYTLSNDIGNGLRLRLAGGVEYKDEHLTIRGEYVWGKTAMPITVNDDPSSRNMITQGAYLVAGYWFKMGKGNGFLGNQKISPIVRVDFYQQDIDVESYSIYYSVGMDWWPEKHLRFTVNYNLMQRTGYDQLGHGVTAALMAKF